MKVQKVFFAVYLFLILFSFTDGFGLRPRGGWGGLGTDSVGPFGILQLLLFAICFWLALSSGKELFNIKCKLSKSVKVFLSLFLVITIQLFFQSLFDMEKIIKIKNLLDMKAWLLLFSIPTLYKYCGLDLIIKEIKFSGFVSALVVVLVLALQIPGTGIQISLSLDASRSLRVLIPTASIITLAFYFFLASYKQEKKTIDIVGAFICFVAVFIQLHRSSIGALLLTTFIFLIIEFKSNIGSISLLLLGGIIILAILFSAVGYSFEMLGEVFTSSKESISSGDDRGTSMRFAMMINAINYVVPRYLILGIGLDWKPVDDMDLYNELQFAEAPTSDNGYFNIIIVFGILGIILFLIMIYRLLYSSFNNRSMYSNGKEYIIICTGITYYLIYTYMVSLGGDRFLTDSIFPIVVGMVVMNEMLLRKRNKPNILNII